MKSLEDLREIADETLGGLNATPGLKYRIQQEAAKGSAPKKRRIPVTAIASVCCAMVLTVGAVAALTRTGSQPNTLPPTVTEVALAETRMVAEAEDVLESAAVPMATSAPMLMADAECSAEEADYEAADLIMTMAAGAEAAEAAEPDLIAVNSKSVTVSGRNAPDYVSLWENGSGSAFPLIRVDGRYYRMLTEPYPVPRSLLGKKVGSVSEYTLEPSLSTTGAVMSNSAGAGSDVWEISGMGGTIVVAEVNGNLRAFQRVSFSGNALRGNEGLCDTLQLSGHITSIALSDVGTVTGSDCERLYNLLCSNAVYESNGSLTNRQSLLFTLDNGLTVQLAVKGDRVAGCGVWSCPEFFDAFSDACN